MHQLLISRSPYRQSLRSSSLRRSRSFNRSVSSIRSTGRSMRFEFNSFFIIASLLVIGALMTFFYLTNFNNYATKGYELKRLQADRAELLSEYELRNMNLARVQAYSNMITSDKLRRMRKASQVSFVHGETAIASR
jgi:hypothetical protein